MTHDTDAVPFFRRDRSCLHVALLTCLVPSPSLSHTSRSLSVDQMNESAASRIVLISRMPRSPPTSPATSCSNPVAISAPRHCQDHRCIQRQHTYTSTRAHRKAEIGPSLTDRANRQHKRNILCPRSGHESTEAPTLDRTARDQEGVCSKYCPAKNREAGRLRVALCIEHHGPA